MNLIIDMPMPKNCLDCPLCQGEYGKGNEKSYCAIKPKVKLKYRGSRPKECPIIKVRLQEEITNDDIQQAIKEGFANGYEMAKAKLVKKLNDRVEKSVCKYCQMNKHCELCEISRVFSIIALTDKEMKEGAE